MKIPYGFAKKILFILYFLKFLVIQHVRAQPERCIGYDPVTLNCTDCAYGYYRNISKSFVDLIRPIDCLTRSVIPYKKTVYISTTKCATTAKCNGTSDFPYDTWYKAMWNEGIQANMVQYSELDFRFLNNNHMIMRKEVLVYPPLFFRRTNIKLTMRPYFCDEPAGSLPGCFQDRDSRAFIFLKTDVFYIFIAQSLTINNIDFYGNDLSITSTGVSMNNLTACYNLDNTINCCPFSLLSISFTGINKNACGLYFRPIAYPFFNTRNIFFSFFNLEPLYDDPIIKSSPQLIINNSNFFYMNSIKVKEGWASIIGATKNFPILLRITNTNISSFKMIRGIIFVESQGIYYPKEANSTIFQNNSFENSIVFENIVIEKLNEFQVYQNRPSDTDPPSETGVFTLNGYPGYFSTQNSIIRMNNNNVEAFSIYSLSFCSNVSLRNISVYNSSRQIFIHNNYSTIELSGVNISDYKFNSPMINMKNGILMLQGVNLLNISGGSINFININSAMFLLFSSVTMSNSSFLGFRLTSIQINITNMSIKDCFFNFTPFELNNADIYFQNIIFDGLTTNVSEFLRVSSDQGQAIEFKVIDSYFKNIFLPANSILISWNNAGSEDSLFLERLQFVSCSLSQFIVSSRLPFIKTEEITIFNENVNSSNSFGFMISTLARAVQINNIRLVNLIVPENFVYLAQSLDLSSILISNVELENIFQSSQRFFQVDMNEGVYKNIKFEKFYTLVESGQETVLFSLEKHFTLLIESFSMNLDEQSNLVVFFLSNSGPVNLIDCMISFKDPLFPIRRMRSLVLVSFLTENILVRNLTAENLEWYSKQLSIFYRNGFLNFLSSETFLYQSNNHVATLFNISLLNCGETPNGALGFLNIDRIVINNVYILNSKAVQGGAIFILWSSIADLYNITVKNSEAEKGGAFCIINVGYLNVTNLSILDSKALIGGAVVLEKIKTLFFSQASMINVLALKTGGGLYIKQVNCTITGLSIVNSISLNDGGGVYFDGGIVTFRGLICLTCVGDRGGFMFVFKAETLDISDITVDGALMNSSSGSGIGLMITEVGDSVIDRFTIKNIASPKALGIIYIENKRSESFLFRNLKCLNNTLLIGTCIYYTSNNKVTLLDTIVSGNKGITFFFTSLTKPVIDLNNLDFQNNQPNENFSHNYLFDCQSVIISIKGLKNTFTNNKALTSVFNLVRCDLLIQNVFFQGNLNANWKLSFTFMQVSASNVKFDFITYKGQIDSAFYSQKGGSFNFTNSNVLSCITEEKACFLISSTNLIIENSKILNCRGKYVGGFKLIDSNAQFTNTIFENNSYFESGNEFAAIITSNIETSSDIFTTGENLVSALNVSIQSCLFSINKLSVLINSCLKFICLNSTFKPHSPMDYKYNKALLILQTNTSSLSDSYFANLSSKKGGAFELINIANTASHSLSLSNCNFLGNQAEVGGAIFIYGWVEAGISKSVFKDNRAMRGSPLIHSGIGGVAYVVCKNCHLIKIRAEENLFYGNNAEFYGPTIFSLAQVEELPNKSNQFINNTDGINFTNFISSLPMKFNNSELNFITSSPAMNNDTNNRSMVIVSGMDFSFNVTIMDNQGNILKFDNYSASKMNKSLTKVKITRGAATSKQGVINFDKMRINYNPGGSFEINILIEFDDETLFPYFIEPNLDNQNSKSHGVFARKCLMGEIFLEGDQSCNTCSSGEYSIIDPMNEKYQNQKCMKCPENAICNGGGFITPMSGYWRANSNSTKIIACLCSSCCLGGSEFSTGDEAVRGKCMDSHHGPLCYVCEENYARYYSKGPCESCKSNSIMYLKLSAAFLGIYIYIIIQVKFTFRKTRSHSGILMKQLINHLQQINMISLLDLGWTPDIKGYFGLNQYISFASEEMISVDCLIIDIKGNVLAKRVIMTYLMPIFLSLIIIMVLIATYYIDKLWKKRLTVNYLVIQTRASIVVIVYLLFPEILRKCFSLMNCLEIDDVDNTKVLLYSPDIQCWSWDHVNYVLIGSLPGITVWGLVVPLIVWFYLWLFKDNPNLFTANNEAINVRGSKIGSKEFIPNIEGQEYPKSTKIVPEARSPLGSQIDSFKNLEKRSPSLQNSTQKNSEEILVSSIKTPAKQRSSIGDKLKLMINKRRSSAGDTLDVHSAAVLMRFFYKGYQQKFYYWELVMFSKKFILIFISTFTEVFPSGTKATILLIILTFYLFLQTRYQPFESQYLNRLEYLSLIATFATANVGIMLYSEEIRLISVVFLVAIVLLNVAFILLWLKTFVLAVFLPGRDIRGRKSYIVNETKLK